MAMANRAGRFRAQIIDKGVSETGPNNLATFIPRFFLTEEWNGSEWVDIGREGLEITGYVYIEKKDGSLNTRAIENLKSAFGWDGRDIMWLQESALPDCQVTCEFETYNGQERLKVQWINPYDSTGSGEAIPKADDNTRKRLANRLGAKLRATAGGSPAAKPTGKPQPRASTALPPPAAAPPRKIPPPSAAEKQIATEADAWTAFTAHEGAQGLDGETLGRLWFETIEKVVGQSSDLAAITPGQWNTIAQTGPSIPF